MQVGEFLIIRSARLTARPWTDALRELLPRGMYNENSRLAAPPDEFWGIPGDFLATLVELKLTSRDQVFR